MGINMELKINIDVPIDNEYCKGINRIPINSIASINITNNIE